MFDSSVEALTPEGIKFVLSPVGLPVRTLAYAIDKITQWLIIILFSVIFTFFQGIMGFWLFLILYFLIDWFYHVFCELTFNGQSFGKRLMKIRVIKSDGSPVDPAASFLRNLLRFADTFFFFFPVALISISASRGFRRIGDWAGGTIVIYSLKEKNSSLKSLNYLLEKYKPISPAAPLSFDEKQAILNFARRYPLLGEARANEIAGIYAPYLRNENESGLSDSAFLLGIARKLSG